MMNLKSSLANRIVVTQVTLKVMIELFPTDVLVGWFPNQNEQRALVSHGPLRTHVTNLFVSVNLSHRQQFRTLSVRYQANTPNSGDKKSFFGNIDIFLKKVKTRMPENGSN